MDKDVRWVGSSLDDQRALPRDWKAITSVGPGVMEVRVRVGGAFRMMYVAKLGEALS